jgi:hypothetical protein
MTCKWALDEMEKMPKQPLETFVIHERTLVLELRK